MTDCIRHIASCFLGLALSVAFVAAPAIAQNAVADSGLFVTVPNPLTSDGYTRIKNRIDAARSKPEARPSVVIFDFNPNDKDANTPDVGPCYDLGDYIAKLTDIATVGYVHQKVTGHTVLPVLACKELVFGPKGVLGEIISTNEPVLTGYRANAYSDVIGQTRPAYLALVRKMFDKELPLRKGRKGNVDWFVDLRERDKLVKEKIEIADNAPLPLAPDGKLGLFTANQLREFGLNRRTIDSRRDLIDAYGLPPTVLREDPLAGKAVVGYRYVLRGPVDGGMKESMGRIIAEAIRNKGNVFFLQLECHGGDPQAARELAEKLIEFQQNDDGIRIIGFVPDGAPDTAAIIALGCSEIVMSKRKDASQNGDGPLEAELGDFDTNTGKLMMKENQEFWVTSLRELAERQGYPPLLIEGMLKKDGEILRVHKKSDRRVRRLMTDAEFQQDKDKGIAAEWVVEKSVKGKGQLLKLSATQAEELGLVRFTTDTREPNELYAKYGLDSSKVRDATPAWLDRFANFLKNPMVTVLLVVIGFTGLILELKVPGTTVPGIVAALCFILVFWAHTQFSGQVAVLAALLFIMGLILILMEVFVFPGFGVPGIVGVVLMLGALGLATVGTTDGGFPTTAVEWTRLGGKMGQYLFGMMGAVALSFTIARYLPNIPYANRMMLVPPGDKPTDETDINILPGAAQAASLLGAVGISMTVLRPAGTVRFGDEFVDVVTDGSYIPAGTRVQVFEVEGNRIVVKEV